VVENMKYKDILKPNFKVEYWINYCRGLTGHYRDEYLNLLILPIEADLEISDNCDQNNNIVNLIISIINNYNSNKIDLFEDIIEQVFNDV